MDGRESSCPTWDFQSLPILNDLIFARAMKYSSALKFEAPSVTIAWASERLIMYACVPGRKLDAVIQIGVDAASRTRNLELKEKGLISRAILLNILKKSFSISSNTIRNLL
jgi:hypothetical protein